MPSPAEMTELQDEWRTRMATASERELAESLVALSRRNEELQARLREAEELVRRLTWYAECLILRIDDRSTVNYTTLNDGRAYLSRVSAPQKGEK